MIDKIPRPDVLPSVVRKIKTGYGTLYVTITELDGKPFEVFATIGKPGKSIAVKAEVIGRLITLALKHSVPVKEIINQISGLVGDEQVMVGNVLIKSIPDAIGFVLKERYDK